MYTNVNTAFALSQSQ